MKERHTLIAAAVLATLPTLSMGQAGSSVQIYGRIETSVNHQSISSTATTASSSRKFVSADTPWLGFRGSEDLGDGWRAFFKMEHGFLSDTGALASPVPGQFWNREVFVGLGNPAYGSVLMGSQYTPSLMMTARIDPFMRGNLGAVFNMFQQGLAGPLGYAAAFNNSAQYQSPVWGGLQVKLLAGLTEGVAPGGRPISSSLEYTLDRFYAAASYDRIKVAGAAVQQPARPAVDHTTTQLAATYRFDPVKLHGYFIKVGVDGSYGMKGGMVGVSVPVGVGSIAANYQSRRAEDPANSHAQSYALQYSHFLSKRSTVYVGVAKQNNEGNANFGMWPSRLESGLFVPAGADVTGFQVGMRHYF